MITKELLDPQSIVVVGGSDNIAAPGGRVLKNLLDHHFKGKLFVVNPKNERVQGINSLHDVKDLPQVDFAIIAIAAKYCKATVEVLAKEKNTRGFVILSAGFSEEGKEGAQLEKDIVEIIDSVGGSLIGPNCIGILNQNHTSVFTRPVPEIDNKGIDFISGSGATAVFIMEAAVTKGLRFASVYSVGNSAQIGVEDVLEYLDDTYDPENSSRVKILYIESINNPLKLLKHARSLVTKGCRIAAVKAGSSEAGSRAASSHTGALASPDIAVDALFRKAGIVRCYGRDELVTVASVFMQHRLEGKRIAIITHAGGPAVMLTDALAAGGMEIPPITGIKAGKLKEKLFPGSSVANPIDFLATGTAEQLGYIIDAVNNDFENIDGMVVIFGSPGLFPVYDVYDLLDEKMKTSKKPIFPVLPSIINVKDEIEQFISKGHVSYPDEVIFGNALCKVYNTIAPPETGKKVSGFDTLAIRKIIDKSGNGYLTPRDIGDLLDAAGITRAKEATVNGREEAAEKAVEIGFPLVMKVVGPVHKSDVGGVVLDVDSVVKVKNEFARMMKIQETTAILMQPMLSGTELFAGVKREDKFGHMILCGLGGIFIEVLKDVNAGLAPITNAEADWMIKNLKSYKIIEGVRGQEGVNESIFNEIIVRLSMLVETAPEIFELDLNPLLGNSKQIVAVDARIRIEK